MTVKLSQNNSQNILSALFASSARVALLRIFLLDPNRSYYQRQLEGATGMALRAIQRELERLVNIELLYRHQEGNRAYYTVDPSFPLLADLRSMVMIAGDFVDRLRGELAVAPEIRLAFVNIAESTALVVADGPVEFSPESAEEFSITTMDSEEFLELVEKKSKRLRSFLEKGVDILGRRDDVIWRRIEAAGYHIEKGEGIP
jgi:DNA-binding transcriptional ArsR family regulator